MQLVSARIYDDFKLTLILLFMNLSSCKLMYDANGEAKGRIVLIPKVSTQPADANECGFEWQRL